MEINGYEIGPGEDLRGIDFTEADLTEANLIETDFTGCELVMANLSGAKLTGADFTKADLTRANLAGADIRFTCFKDADLSGANLSGARLSSADLTAANLKWANLSQTVLNGTCLHWVDLRWACLADASLNETILTRANLSGTNMSRADLSGATIGTANLTGANFTDANLSGVDLSSANCSGAIGLDVAEALRGRLFINGRKPMYSSTSLEGPSKSGCFKPIDFMEQGADSLFPLMYRSYLGQAAHSVLQYCAERRTETEDEIRATAEEVGKLLISKGRTFRGREEPPLPADDVWQGVDIAVNYLLGRGLPLDAQVLIAERDWHHTFLPYLALIDLVAVQEEGEEEYSVRACEVSDWKSSWQTDAEDLDTLQRWGQVVVIWRAIEAGYEDLRDIQIIRQRAVNLRTWGEWTRVIHLDRPADVAELEKWEKRIEEYCRLADSVKKEVYINDPGHQMGTFDVRPTNPGAGCLSCAYRHICPDCWDLAKQVPRSIDNEALNLAKIEAQRSLAIKVLKGLCQETPIAIQGGWVGFKETHSRVFKEGQERTLLDEWLERLACEIPEEDMPVLVSLLSALNLGKGNLDAFAKALMPERKKGIVALRDEYVESLTVDKRQKRFGVWEETKEDKGNNQC